jgi:hypothetical protein
MSPCTRSSMSWYLPCIALGVWQGSAASRGGWRGQVAESSGRSRPTFGLGIPAAAQVLEEVLFELDRYARAAWKPPLASCCQGP